MNPLVLESLFWISVLGPVLGGFVVFRRLSFAGDAMGHASLAGVATAAVLTAGSVWFLSMGAIVSVMAAFAFLRWLEKKIHFSSDLALTVASVLFFAWGLFLLGQSPGRLESNLLGNLFMPSEDQVIFLRAWTCIVLGLILILWRPLWLLVIDKKLARSLGYSLISIEIIFMGLLAVTIVGLMQTVGVLLIGSYLVLPAAGAVVWARSLTQLLLLSVFMACLGSALGLSIILWRPDFQSPALLALTQGLLMMISFTVFLGFSCRSKGD
jgi:zinc transport system permease protein